MTPEHLSSVTAEVSDTLHDVAEEIKPRLRGWLHAGTLPLSLGAGIVLVALSPTPAIRLASAVFMVTALLLFGVSALYHTGTWSPRAKDRLKRLDHANIFLLIAGSYTPFAILLLDGRDAVVLLTLVWVGALLGVAFRVLWVGAPRWLYVPVYIALGWAAIFWLHDFARAGGPVIVTLMLAGGALYSIGALVYAFRRPNPAPAWFGFHEIFHSLTIAAFCSHYAGISLAAYALR